MLRACKKNFLFYRRNRCSTGRSCSKADWRLTRVSFLLLKKKISLDNFLSYFQERPIIKLLVKWSFHIWVQISTNLPRLGYLWTQLWTTRPWYFYKANSWQSFRCNYQFYLLLGVPHVDNHWNLLQNDGNRYWQVFLTCDDIKERLKTTFLWWMPGHDDCVWTLVHIHYNTQFHTFQRNHQSLQWNVCAAHVNNFSSNLVACIDFSGLSGATVGWSGLSEKNNIELKWGTNKSRTGSTRTACPGWINSDRLGSNKKIKIK